MQENIAHKVVPEWVQNNTNIESRLIWGEGSLIETV